MLDDIKSDAEDRMSKSIQSLSAAFAKIRTGRAHPGILDGITVDYYGTETPLNQVANVSVEDARTLAVSPWEKPMVPVVELAVKALSALSTSLDVNVPDVLKAVSVSVSATVALETVAASLVPVIVTVTFCVVPSAL